MASAPSCFSGPEVLEDADHGLVLVRELKCLYDCGLLGDVTIGVEPDGESAPGDVGRLFLCSRNVLSAASMYFRRMFTGGLHESVQERVVIRGVDAESMAVIIDYCYTGRVSITEGNVQRLYAAAHMLQLEYIRKSCSSFMTRRLDLSNCVQILKFADTFDDPELKDSAQTFIARNFGQVCNGGELCELDLGQVKELLSLNTLDVDCERKVCSAALQWVEANAPEGKDDALQVLKCVRWNLFAEKDKPHLERLMARPLTGIYLELFFNRSVEDSGDIPLPEQRMGVSGKEMILFFGPPNNKIICCDPYSGDLYSMAPPLEDLSSQYHRYSSMDLISCATQDNNLYLASPLSKHFWMYKPILNSWQELAERPLWRIYFSMGYLNGHVYLLGGRNPVTSTSLQEVECYSVQRNQWTFVAPLPTSIDEMEVLALNDHLYVVSRKTMLCYDPKRNSWRHCGTLITDKLHSACVFQDQIVCMCDLPVVKAYSPTSGEWKRLSNTPIYFCPAGNLQVIQHNGKLLLFAEISMQRNKYGVQIHEYDPSRDTWASVTSVYVSSLRPMCVSTRVYPACLGSVNSFSTEEEDDSGSSADWGFDGLRYVDWDSGSSNSFSD